MVRAVWAEWRRNLSTALGVATDRTGLTREEFAEWIERDPRAFPMYMQVLWAFAMNGHDTTLKAMGAVFAQVALAARRGDEDALGKADLALKAMRDLSFQHFLVLYALGRRTQQAEQEGGGDAALHNFSVQTLAEDTGLGQERVLQRCVNLTGAGLTRRHNLLLSGPPVYPLTDLGRAIVEAVEAMGG